jgi:hypothetical protein
MRFWPVRDQMHFRHWKRREFVTLLGGDGYYVAGWSKPRLASPHFEHVGRLT